MRFLGKSGSWQDVLNECRASVGKEALEKEPSTEFKKEILIAEHSPVRCISLNWIWEGIPYWVAMHFKTHIWQSTCRTQRNDRQTDYDRNEARQDAPVEMICHCNPQHLIDTSRKRLCRKAAKETRNVWERTKDMISKEEPEMALCMVPNCIYRWGCPEKDGCGELARFRQWLKTEKGYSPDYVACDIYFRYLMYREFKEEKVELD